MRHFYQTLDNAQGEQEIKPIMQQMEAFIAQLSAKDKIWAEQDFKYYITKRIQKSEERIDRLNYEMRSEID